MFWDKASGFYDFFEKHYNGEVNKALVEEVAQLINETDNVLECACGTGMISKAIAAKSNTLVATDFSDGMLNEARKKCAKLENVSFQKADICQLPFETGRFDKVVAGNVIHLLEDPKQALLELERVCVPGGKIIVPTYVNNENTGKPSLFVRGLEKFGADFKCQFDYDTYKAFFAEHGFKNVEFSIIEGKMPCAIAVITKDRAFIRQMKASDYDAVYDLWMSCQGMGLNDVDDSREGIEKFIKKNPTTCLVAEADNKIVGVIMIGNDGRRGYIYHTAVHPEYRKNKIATKLVEESLAAIANEGITKVALVAFSTNTAGNAFWENLGFEVRDDLVYRNKALKELVRIDT